MSAIQSDVSAESRSEKKTDREPDAAVAKIKPPTNSFGIFAVFEACIPGQVRLTPDRPAPTERGEQN